MEFRSLPSFAYQFCLCCGCHLLRERAPQRSGVQSAPRLGAAVAAGTFVKCPAPAPESNLGQRDLVAFPRDGMS
jgi:hypothetical protein